MGSGFLKNSVDLDSVFEQRSTAAIANVGHQVAGTDLAQRYEKLASGTAAAATGFKSNNNDLNTLFAAKGTVGSGGGYQYGFEDGLTTGLCGADGAANYGGGGHAGSRYGSTATTASAGPYYQLYSWTGTTGAGAGSFWAANDNGPSNRFWNNEVIVRQDGVQIGYATWASDWLNRSGWVKVNFNTSAKSSSTITFWVRSIYDANAKCDRAALDIDDIYIPGSNSIYSYGRTSNFTSNADGWYAYDDGGMVSGGWSSSGGHNDPGCIATQIQSFEYFDNSLKNWYRSGGQAGPRRNFTTYKPLVFGDKFSFWLRCNVIGGTYSGMSAEFWDGTKRLTTDSGGGLAVSTTFIPNNTWQNIELTVNGTGSPNGGNSGLLLVRCACSWEDGNNIQLWWDEIKTPAGWTA